MDASGSSQPAEPGDLNAGQLGWTPPEYLLASLLYNIAAHLGFSSVGTRTLFLMEVLPHFERDIIAWGGQRRNYEINALEAAAEDGFIRRCLGRTWYGLVHRHSYMLHLRPWQDDVVRAIQNLDIPGDPDGLAEATRRGLRELNPFGDDANVIRRPEWGHIEATIYYMPHGGFNGDAFNDDFQDPRNERPR